MQQKKSPAPHLGAGQNGRDRLRGNSEAACSRSELINFTYDILLTVEVPPFTPLYCLAEDKRRHIYVKSV